MAEDFSNFLIKDYKYWSIFIHPNQGYLGRCVVWCNRENAKDLTEATAAEQKELFLVLDDLKRAVTKAFQPDWFNYAFLGNETRHLHGHVVPRYAKPKEFMGKIFEDKFWGHNYRSDRSFKIPENILKSIQQKLIDAI